MMRLVPLAGLFVALLQQPGLPPRTPVAPAQVHEVVVHGASLEGNLLGVPSDRRVSIYLPPSYATSSRRYPVLYVLHGILDSDRTWTVAWDNRHPGFATIQDVMNRGIAAGCRPCGTGLEQSAVGNGAPPHPLETLERVRTVSRRLPCNLRPDPFLRLGVLLRQPGHAQPAAARQWSREVGGLCRQAAAGRKRMVANMRFGLPAADRCKIVPA